jgi:hypothetical protein
MPFSDLRRRSRRALFGRNGTVFHRDPRPPFCASSFRQFRSPLLIYITSLLNAFIFIHEVFILFSCSKPGHTTFFSLPSPRTIRIPTQLATPGTKDLDFHITFPTFPWTRYMTGLMRCDLHLGRGGQSNVARVRLNPRYRTEAKIVKYLQGPTTLKHQTKSLNL